MALPSGTAPSSLPASLPILERFCIGRTDSQLNTIAGAVGGFASGVATCPLDVIKTKLQAQGGFVDAGAQNHLVYRGLSGTAKTIWREDGIRGFYRGLGPIVLGYIPTWAVYFTVYGNAKTYISRYHKNDLLVNSLASIVAGGSSTLVTNPIWVIKTRLMAQNASLRQNSHHASSSHYRSTIDAARKMYASEGIMSFYSGLAPALIGLTHVAVQFPAYEFLRARFTGQKMGTGPSEGDEKAHWFGILMATIISKITASSATYPHEVIRTRLQAQRRPVAGTEAYQGLGVTVGGPGASNGNGNGSAKQPKYRGVIQTFRTILHEEGWTAFYAGMGTNMVRAVPAAVVTMLTYEFTVTTLKKARHKGEARLGRGIEEAVSR